MSLVRLLLLLPIVSCAAASQSQPTRSASAPSTNNAVPEASGAGVAEDRASLQASPSSPLASTADLTRERALVDESNAAFNASDHITARIKAADAAASLLARPEAEQSADWLTLLDSAGLSAYQAEDMRTANTAWMRVMKARSALLPDEHPELQRAWLCLAATFHALGDFQSARALFEKLLEVRSRTLRDDHPDLQVARHNLAATLVSLGDFVGARTLFEKVLEVDTRTLPADDTDLQAARMGLSVTIKAFGDLAGARVLEERVLEILSRTLPNDHPLLQAARQNLAVTLSLLGDFAGARELCETVLEVESRTLPEDDPDLQAARRNLAVTMKELGDLTGARALSEDALEVLLRTLPGDHPFVQAARQNLAWVLLSMGELATARALFEQVLEVRSRTLSGDHPAMQTVRLNLAVTVACQMARARQTLAVDATNATAQEVGKARCVELLGAVCRVQVHSARALVANSSSREAEEGCAAMARWIDQVLSFAGGYGVFGPLRDLESESFVLSEATRGTAIVSAGLTRRAASESKGGRLREALTEASDELAGLAQKGTSSEELDRARSKRESVERELVASAHGLSGRTERGTELDDESLARELLDREVAVGVRRFLKLRVDVVDGLDTTGQSPVRIEGVESLCAFVVRSASNGAGDGVSAKLELVDLGPIAPIEAAVRAWRDGLGVGNDGRGIAVRATVEATPQLHALGSRVRELIFDPLLPSLAGADHIVVALDDVLHLVPLDALPFGESSLVGEHWRIETRATLTELLDRAEPSHDVGALVAFGDVEYGAKEKPDSADAATQLVAVVPRANEDAGILRGGPWSGGFSALPATGVEVRGIARCFADRFGAGSEMDVREHGEATRERLLSLAPKARYLHIATHGWFAPESIKSWSDPGPVDRLSGLGVRMSGEEQVRGMSPMLLCGLALAGANLPENALGRVPGLITADELSTLDLSNCELVVLSACDTNVGERRAGQGVASLQKALQMAGARSVITSLWKVPDEATKDLMLDFYRRLWIETKPKWQALWEAKKELRDAKGADGRPLYTPRDWAAWVLTGEPD
ncbi:MAG: CHAT domain-containing protein [Planctomycetes bacterium]|nr:CHAT domain-containing protein [Planctomycetota bacterium]